MYELKEPTDNILDLLIHIAKIKNKIRIQKGFDNTNKKVYDIDSAG